MTYRFLSSGYEVDDRTFERIERVVYRYYTGQISGARFERLMRDLGVSRALAYSLYRDIVDNNYERVVEEMVKYLVSVSLVTTGERWSRRYFEIRSLIWVPANVSVRGDVENIEKITCSNVSNIGDLILRMMWLYMESKGYDTPMLEWSDFKYSGIEEVEKMDYDKFWESHEKVPFYVEIWDNGSDSRSMNIRRWYDEFRLPNSYLYDYKDACIKFNEMARRAGYEKRLGKQFRWI